MELTTVYTTTVGKASKTGIENLVEKVMEVMEKKERTEQLTKEEKKILSLLRAALEGRSAETEIGSEDNWREIAKQAERQGVLALLYDVMQTEEIPLQVRRQCERVSHMAVRQNYRLLFLAHYIMELLDEREIKTILLKGMSAAVNYPVPELRRSGDVDLLLADASDLEKAAKVLQEAGFQKAKEQHSNHHVVYIYEPEGISVELHTMLSEPFDSGRMNRYMKEVTERCAEQWEWRDLLGIKLRVLKPGFQAYQLLLHMLQHFLRAGFGVKMLCDWTTFWNHDTDKRQRELFMELVLDSGVQGFAGTVTAACCEYLGMDRSLQENLPAPSPGELEAFLRDLFDAGEFGQGSSERMVVLRGRGIWDYVREFHHQMHLNFPRGGRIFLIWPVLWVMTLAIFLRNNRRLNRGSGIHILRNAGERSRLIEKMDLFQVRENKS